MKRIRWDSAHLAAAVALPPVPARGRVVQAEEAVAEEEAEEAPDVGDEVLKEVDEVLLVLQVAPVGDLDDERHPLLALADDRVVLVRGAVRRVHAVGQLVLPAVAGSEAAAHPVRKENVTYNASRL